ENAREQPLPTEDRRRARRHRRNEQDAALAEQSSALFEARQLNSPEPAAVHAGNPVVPREPLVRERVVGAEQLRHAAVVTQLALQKELGLALEGVAQRLVEGPERRLVRLGGVDAAERQPLREEVGD